MSDRANITSATQSYDALLAGPADQLIEAKVTLITGQNVVRGTVLGKITASGKYNKSLSAAADGSQTPVAIAAEDCDATAADGEMMIYTAGIFNETELTIGTAHTANSIRDGLHDLGIYLRKGMA